MSANAQTRHTEFAPQVEDLKKMVEQDREAARERIAEGTEFVKGYVLHEPIKALGIALGVGVLLGWMIRSR